MICDETRVLLIRLADRYETAEFILGDPSWWMHQVQGARNQEVTAFVASGLSYGSRSQFMPKIGQLLEWAGGDMDRWLREGGYRRHFAEGGKECFYRLYNEGTMRAFLDAYRAMLVEYGSMGEYLSSFNSSFHTPHSSFHNVEVICRWFAEHGSSAVVPKDATSACKRVCMFLRWDEAGNLGQVSMGRPGEMFETGRFLFWTEDNRMHTAVDDRYYSYYAYDYGGERRLKLVGVNSSVDVNAEYMTAVSTLNEPTLYPSAYMVLTNKGYTKHYYAGTERVAARLGGGGLDAQYHVIGNDEELQTKADMLFDQSIEQVNSRVLHENDLDCIMSNEFAMEEFGHWIDGIPHQMKAEVKCDHGLFKEMVHSMLDDRNHGKEEEVYFYHSDHLGSASWITDSIGIPIQHLQYLPYGEPYVDQRHAGATYSERFRFTGKERDEETGYGYFGARYMDHELMTMWLSVDPMADKYPSISPYAYCAWNPVKLVDPDGREFDPATEEKYIKPYENEVKARMDEINRRRGTKKWNDKYDVQYQEYEKILTEIDGLRKDQDNVYSIRTDESSDAKNKLVYKGEREDGKRSIQINLKKRAGMSSVAHELKHAYQYYEGRLGFILDPSGKHVSSNDCKIFEREAFTRGNMFEDALFSKGGRLRIYNVNPDNYKFQNNSQYENYQEYSIISAPSGYTYISNHKKISF